MTNSEMLIKSLEFKRHHVASLVPIFKGKVST